MAATARNEFIRVSQMLSGITVSVPMAMMEQKVFERIDSGAASDAQLASLNRELRNKLKAVSAPEDYTQMAQAYEAYAEAFFYIEMKDRGFVLERTPGTGGNKSKRPDFCYSDGAGELYFEVKALDIADAMRRHPEIGQDALEVAADLDARASQPGIHFSKPIEISGHLPVCSAERIDETIRKIENNIKDGQIRYGPTVLVVDLGRLSGVAQGPSGLLPVFFDEDYESCVSGELWQIALGRPDEHIFSLPEFEGKSNLAGHQKREGILRNFPKLMAITFFLPRWSDRSELLTILNTDWDQTNLCNPCKLRERQIEKILFDYSDGLNDERNELGWDYRINPKPSKGG